MAQYIPVIIFGLMATFLIGILMLFIHFNTKTWVPKENCSEIPHKKQEKFPVKNELCDSESESFLEAKDHTLWVNPSLKNKEKFRDLTDPIRNFMPQNIFHDS